MPRKRIIVLGSTGSIGVSALDVLSRLRDTWRVVGLAAHTQSAALVDQARRYYPEAVAIVDEAAAEDVRASVNGSARVFSGDSALVDMVNQVECDCVLSAVVGVGGLAATIRAVELGRRVALANKEAMVIAGPLILATAGRSGSEIIPIDSEHSAIFQALRAGERREVHKVYLTASGGPFRTWSRDAMGDVTLQDALRHPTWSMGPKITIDSATMMNKALEIVEACWLFGLHADQVGVVVHPESIIHSLVEFRDGSLIAQLGVPDMRTPIQYALTHPNRGECPTDRLDLCAVGRLQLHAPDHDRFPALSLGYEAARRGGTAGAVLNAANEAAVALFREGAIGFTDIARLAEAALRGHDFQENPTLNELLHADRMARDEVKRCVRSCAR